MILNATTATAAGTTIRIWDLPVRLFHWLLAGAILVAFLSSEEASPLAPWSIRPPSRLASMPEPMATMRR